MRHSLSQTEGESQRKYPRRTLERWRTGKRRTITVPPSSPRLIPIPRCLGTSPRSRAPGQDPIIPREKRAVLQPSPVRPARPTWEREPAPSQTSSHLAGMDSRRGSRPSQKLNISGRCIPPGNSLRTLTSHRVSAEVSRLAGLCWGCIYERLSDIIIITYQYYRKTNNWLFSPNAVILQADKGQQVCDRPQAFFLPLDQTNPDQTDLIDLETSAEKDLTDLQGALRKNRPGLSWFLRSDFKKIFNF